LGATGGRWARREAGWVVRAGGSLPCELIVWPAPGGVRVEATLASWDEVTPATRLALAQLLSGAQRGLCFARAELDERVARLASNLPMTEVRAGLGHALGGVAAGAGLLAREAGALLAAEVAEGFLRFFASA